MLHGECNLSALPGWRQVAEQDTPVVTIHSGDMSCEPLVGQRDQPPALWSCWLLGLKMAQNCRDQVSIQCLNLKLSRGISVTLHTGLESSIMLTDLHLNPRQRLSSFFQLFLPAYRSKKFGFRSRFIAKRKKSWAQRRLDQIPRFTYWK